MSGVPEIRVGDIVAAVAVDPSSGVVAYQGIAVPRKGGELVVKSSLGTCRPDWRFPIRRIVPAGESVRLLWESEALIYLEEDGLNWWSPSDVANFRDFLDGDRLLIIGGPMASAPDTLPMAPASDDPVRLEWDATQGLYLEAGSGGKVSGPHSWTVGEVQDVLDEGCLEGSIEILGGPLAGAQTRTP